MFAPESGPSVEKVAVSAVSGRELSQEDLQTISGILVQEFGPDAELNLTPESAEWWKVYVVVRKDDEIVAFGKIKNVDVTFNEEQYHILAIASVVSVHKGKGYGKKLMEHMRAYSQSNEKTTVGFCHSDRCAFYESCGFHILPGGLSRIQFHDQDRNPISTVDAEYHIFYLPGPDGLMDKMAQLPELKIIV